jgi:thiamine transport system ATP-binding protein
VLQLERLTIAQDDWRMRADLAIEAGSAVAVIGPSGAGKSTLLAAIAGFLEPVAGRILWQGRDITRLPPSERPVTLLFQEHNLFAHLSVEKNVGLGLRPDLRLDRAQRAAVAEALDAVGLAGYGGRLPRELSGGQRSRVALARALLRARPLLLLDEPFAALGPALRIEMLDRVAEIRAQQGATLLFVTHHPEDALRIAGETLLVEGGQAHPPMPTEALFADPPPALKDYLGGDLG